MYFTGDSLHLSAPWVAPLDRDVGADRRTRTSALIILRPGTASLTQPPPPMARASVSGLDWGASLIAGMRRED
jgi:hypothetical protein